jgi:hypothetical protein
MKNDANPKQRETTKLVDALTLLDIVFDERSRPTLRTMRTWTKKQVIPCVRCGGLVYYDLEQVRAALANRHVKTATHDKPQPSLAQENT